MYAASAPRADRRGLFPGPRSDPRAKLVERRRHLSLPAKQPAAELAPRLGKIDLIYEAAGASQLAFDALEQLGTNGVFVFTGVPGRKHRIEVAGDTIMRNLVLRNQTVLGTVNAARIDFESAVRDLAGIRERWAGTLEALITGRYSMEHFCERAAGAKGIKDVIAVSETG